MLFQRYSGVRPHKEEWEKMINIWHQNIKESTILSGVMRKTVIMDTKIMVWMME